MFRNDDPTAVSALPAAPAPTGSTPGYFTDGNPATGIAGTIVPDWWLTQIQEELVSIVLAAGIALAKGTNQVLTALKTLFVQCGGGLNQRAIGSHALTLGLSSTSTAVRATVDTTDLGELAAFGNGNLSIGAWTEQYFTPGNAASNTISLSFTAPRAGTVLALTAQDNFVATVASGSGVSLPNAPLYTPVLVCNDGANALAAYPSSAADQIGTAAAGAASTVTAGLCGVFERNVANHWDRVQ